MSVTIKCDESQRDAPWDLVVRICRHGMYGYRGTLTDVQDITAMKGE